MIIGGVMVKSKISRFLIIIGVILLLIPIGNTVYVKMIQQEMIRDYFLNNGDSDKTGSEDESKDSASSGKEQDLYYSRKWEVGSVMGVIIIPKIKVDLPIIQGVGKDQLKAGIGHFEGSDLPGQIGNCALAGHRSYTYGKMFNRLGEIQLGDTIEIKFGSKDYVYKVYKIDIVNPEDISVLSRNDKDRILTLVTCHPIRIANKRLIIFGKLEE